MQRIWTEGKKWNLVKYFGLAIVPLCLTQLRSLKLTASVSLGCFPSSPPHLWLQLLNKGIPSQEGQGQPKAQQTTITLPPCSASVLPKQDIIPQVGSLQGSHPTMHNRKQADSGPIINRLAKLSLKSTSMQGSSWASSTPGNFRIQRGPTSVLIWSN